MSEPSAKFNLAWKLLLFVENINFTVNAPEDQLGTVSLHLNLTFAEYLLVPWAPLCWGPPAIHLKALVLLFNPPGPPVPLPIVPSVPPPSTFKLNLTAYVDCAFPADAWNSANM